MKKSVLAVAMSTALGLSAGANAAGIEDELAAIKARLSALEQQVQDQNAVIREKEREIAELKSGTADAGSSRGDGWFNKVEVGGLIEVEASHVSADGANDDDDLVTGTVELGIAAQVNDWVGAEIVLKFEEETDNSDGTNSDIDVDTAMVTVADPDSNWFVNAGQYTLPFGMYPTNMVTDPLTLELGETGDTAIEFGMNFGPLTASVFTFDGDNSNSAVNRFGAALGAEMEGNGVALNAHLGYLSDISETDGFVDYGVDDNNDSVPGWIASAELSAGAFILIAEYLAATDSFSAAPGDEPSAFNVEAGVNFEFANRPAVFAVSHQKTDDMGTIDPDFAEKRNSAAFTVESMDGTSIAIEYLTQESYAGDDTDIITGQLAVEF
ncbi:MAG: carbohydrate porin [Gammaproteobacteria bacterium]|nr:carbohydrate porin [Gammaproteobacteria bacterium]